MRPLQEMIAKENIVEVNECRSENKCGGTERFSIKETSEGEESFSIRNVNGVLNMAE